jgi:hypothetical protein
VVQPVHRQGAGEPRTEPWISEGPIAIAIDVLFWFFHFLGIFSTQILNFERRLTLSSAHKAVFILIFIPNYVFLFVFNISSFTEIHS